MELLKWTIKPVEYYCITYSLPLHYQYTTAMIIMTKPIRLIALAILISSMVLSGGSSSYGKAIPVTMRMEIGGDSYRKTIHSIPTRLSTHISTDQVPIAVYAPGSLYYSVVQQPQDNPAFVSTSPDQVTQFSIPASYGTVGLLAHNNLAGSAFFSLHPGQEVVLVYDGRVEEIYEVDSIEEFQAIEPSSPYSDFIDIDQNQFLDSNSAFERVYEQPNRVVFQTCIARDGIPNWGRLFVTAVPIEETKG